MRSVRGYEEKDPEIMRQLTSGYPRFVVHPFARQLGAHFTASLPALAGRTLWLVTSERMARALVAHLGGEAAGARLFAHEGLFGASHPASPELYARAKVYLQNIGGFLSSREAEDHLVRLGLLAAPYPENAFPAAAAGGPRGHDLPGHAYRRRVAGDVEPPGLFRSAPAGHGGAVLQPVGPRNQARHLSLCRLRAGRFFVRDEI